MGVWMKGEYLGSGGSGGVEVLSEGGRGVREQGNRGTFRDPFVDPCQD